MPARLDPFLHVMQREPAEQLYRRPDEPVTLVKDGKTRKVSNPPLTDLHIYALMVEVAPPEAADKIDQQSETEFDYAGANGLVRVRIVPEGGRLTAVISAVRRASQEGGAMPVVQSPVPTTGKRPAAQAASPAPTPTAPSPAAGKQAAPAKAPRASVIAAAPMVDSPVSSPGDLPGEFGSSEFQAAEQKLGKLLRALVQASSSDLHLRVGEPPMLRPQGEDKGQRGCGTTTARRPGAEKGTVHR